MYGDRVFEGRESNINGRSGLEEMCGERKNGARLYGKCIESGVWGGEGCCGRLREEWRRFLRKGGGFWCGEWCLSEGRMFKVWKGEGEEKLEGG